MDDNSKYRDLFFEETDEHLQTLDDCILELEQSPEDSNLLDEIFRAAHSLKGMAGSMGYKTMEKLTHRMENVFELFRSHKVKVESDIISLIFKCLDTLSEIVEDLRAENSGEYDITNLLEDLDKVGNIQAKEEASTGEDLKDLSLSDGDKSIIETATEAGYQAFNIEITVSDDCLLKAARAYLIIKNLDGDGEILHTDPSMEDIEEGKYKKSFRLVYLTEKPIEFVRKKVENNIEIEKTKVEFIKDALERLASKEEEEKVQVGQAEKEDLKEKLGQEPKGEKQKTSKAKEKNNNSQKASIRVNIDRLDSFMNLVSELVIYRTRLEDINSRSNNLEIGEPLEQVAKITSELQDLVLKLRMQPVDIVLNRFNRTVRDLSQNLGKDIKLVIEGEETELDRTVVSELGDPLLHLIRNAADHGIESLDERRKANKPEKGTIKIVAYQEGDNVVITVSDDGKGIDPKIIKKSAESKGIDTENLSDKEIVQLIFHQGFSTVKKVTNVSGRGVGMDVVHQKIAELGGSIEVITKVGKGTDFVIRLPLTLSIVQALMVEVGSEKFAIPLSIIKKVMKLDNSRLKKSHTSEIYTYRDEAIPVIRLSEKLRLESNNDDSHIILITLGDKNYGVLIDNFIGQQEIVIKKLGGSLKHLKEYIGATILGNGDIVLILDISNLAKNSGEDNV